MGEERTAAQPGAKWAPRKPLLQVNGRHHAVAQMIVQGRKLIEVSQETGYSATYLSRIQKDAVMQELLARYTRQREQAFDDNLRRQMENYVWVGRIAGAAGSPQASPRRSRQASARSIGLSVRTGA